MVFIHKLNRFLWLLVPAIFILVLCAGVADFFIPKVLPAWFGPISVLLLWFWLFLLHVVLFFTLFVRRATKKQMGRLLIPIVSTPASPKKTYYINMSCGVVFAISGYCRAVIFTGDERYLFVNQLIGVLMLLIGTLMFIGEFFPYPSVIRSQVGENGIVDNRGDFYDWREIESFLWTRGIGRLTFTLKPFILYQKKVVVDRIPSELRAEIYAHIEQHIKR